jgi:hypothetical protein
VPLRLPCLLANACSEERFKCLIPPPPPDLIRQSDNQVFQIFGSSPLTVRPCKPGELDRDAKGYQQTRASLLVFVSRPVNLIEVQDLSQIVSRCPK